MRRCVRAVVGGMKLANHGIYYGTEQEGQGRTGESGWSGQMAWLERLGL